MYPHLDDVGGQEYDPPRAGRYPDELDAQHEFEAPGTCQDRVHGPVSGRLVCTRPEAHDGDHVAGDSIGLVYGRWPAQGYEEDDECPNCRNGTLEESGDDLVCRGECGQIFKKKKHPTARHRCVPKEDRCVCGAAKLGFGKDRPAAHSNYCPWHKQVE